MIDQNQTDSFKAEVLEYWTERCHSFAHQHWDELHSPKRDLWESELRALMPEGRGLRVVDLGCGSGFLALVLAQMGHEITGVDMAPHMVMEARAASDELGLDARFITADAENPPFDDSSFDVIVTRNLTWTLPDVPRAYANWFKMLKPGGFLINFDGDYVHETVTEEDLPQEHVHRNIGEDLTRKYAVIKDHLWPDQPLRPVWDVELLGRAGFDDIVVDEGLSERVYPQVDRFYNPTPMFSIRARRPLA